MSLKDNFNQAIKELLKKDGLVGSNLSKEAKMKSETDKLFGSESTSGAASGALNMSEQKLSSVLPMSESLDYGTDFSKTAQTAQSVAAATPVTPAAAPSAPSAEAHEAMQSDDFSSDPFGEISSQSVGQQNSAAYGSEQNVHPNSASSQDTYRPDFGSFSAQSTPPPTPVGKGDYRGYNNRNPQPIRGGRPPESPYYETEETTIISRNTIINGDISSFANINVDGSVQGDVKLTKDISVTGKVVGNIECNNATMNGSSMQGSVNSKGQVQMDRDSILLGDIATQYLDLNGRIQGNVDVGGKAEFKTDAVIVGNITASTISVIDGAVIKGYVNTTFMQDSAANIFPEAIIVGE